MNKFNLSSDVDVGRRGILAMEILTGKQHQSGIQQETDMTSPNLVIEGSYILPPRFTLDSKISGNYVISLFTIPGNVSVASFDSLFLSGSNNFSVPIFNSLSVSISDNLSAFKKEQQAFLSMRKTLKNLYAGKYVAIYGGQVVDSDVNESALIGRFYKTYGNVPVYIDKTEEIQRIPKVVTPRKIR